MIKCSFRGLTCFSDVWGESIMYSYADVIVRQWILSPFDLLNSKMISASPAWLPPLPAPGNITNAEVVVECNYAQYSCR